MNWKRRIKRESSVEVVPVLGGTFRMGADLDAANQRPMHQVTVSSFFMARYEVTQAQYKDVTGRNPSCFKGDPKLPVEDVSWFDAVAFCNALSAMEWKDTVYIINGKVVTADFSKNGWRLPTEAEWEYAARGGNDSKGFVHAGSNDALEVGWFDENASERTQAVGCKAPNELGLYDMSGNVLEWCQDWYAGYQEEDLVDPRGAASGPGRVIRGSSFCVSASNQTVADRNHYYPEGSYLNLGFRVVRSKP